MKKDFKIKPPFFEIGPKAFFYGQRALKLAKAAERASKKYDVRIIFTPQYTDIRLLAQETSHLYIFAQHLDSLQIGRGHGLVLAEALKDAGASGVILNHSEKPMVLSEIRKSIQRAKEVGLISMV